MLSANSEICCAILSFTDGVSRELREIDDGSDVEDDVVSSGSFFSSVRSVDAEDLCASVVVP